jgi:hypothetical protein
MNEEAAELARRRETREGARLRAQQDEPQGEAIDQQRREIREPDQPRGAFDPASEAPGDDPLPAVGAIMEVARELAAARRAEALAQAEEDTPWEQPSWVGFMPEPPATARERALQQELTQVRQELEALRQRVERLERAGS